MSADLTMECEICDATFTAADEATLPPSVRDDGRAGRFCPACRCDLIEDWPDDELEERELAEIAEWRSKHDAGTHYATKPRGDTDVR